MQATLTGLNSSSLTKHAMLNSETIYLLVNDEVFDDLENHLAVYTDDLNNEGYDVQVFHIPGSGGYNNHTAIRSLLQVGYQNDNLAGCIFVGRIPYVTIEGDNRLISDFYYMDLDGVWADRDGNGMCDDHTGQKNLEIWVGRIWTPNGGNNIELLKNYFRKNHAYRVGNLILPKRALYYETREDQWHDPIIEEEYLTNLRLLYDDVTLVAPWEGEPSPSDYLNKLQQGYEFIYLHSWSTATSHTFTNGNINYYDIEDTDPKAFFYLLSACNVANYEDYHYLASAYIFSQSYGLTAIAPTTSSYQHPVWIYAEFVDSINNGKSIGESFKQYYNTVMQTDPHISCHYSHTVLGDPLLVIAAPQGLPPENTPPATPTITGSINGNISETYSYTISSTDTDLDRIYYIIDWGDGTINQTATAFQSGSKFMVSHSWNTQGTYDIRVKAVDERDSESDWATVRVSMPQIYKPPCKNSLQILFEWILQMLNKTIF